MDSVVRKGVALIVIDQQKFLLLKHKKNGLWGFISGGIEPGENSSAAVVREAKEESGIDIDKNKLISTEKTISFVSSRGLGEQKVYLYRLIEPTDVAIDNNEISEFGWFQLEEAKKVLIPKQALIDTLSDLFGDSVCS